VRFENLVHVFEVIILVLIGVIGLKGIMVLGFNETTCSLHQRFPQESENCSAFLAV